MLTEENTGNALDPGDEKKGTPAAPQAGAFPPEERSAYFKKRWRKGHIPLYVILFFILAASIALPFVFGRPYFIEAAPLVALIEYGYQNNRMMAWVEKKLYG